MGLKIQILTTNSLNKTDKESKLDEETKIFLRRLKNEKKVM